MIRALSNLRAVARAVFLRRDQRGSALGWMPERVRHDRRGVAAVEFALILPMLLLLIMGGIEVGHILYMRNVLYGELERAARGTSLESGAGGEAAIDARLAEVVREVAPDATFDFRRRAYRDYQSVGKAEPFEDTNSNDACDNNETFTDLNGNGQWDRDSGLDGIGGAREVAVYDIRVQIRSLIPSMERLLGQGPFTLETTTQLRNQPYAPDKPPATGTCP